MHPHPFLDIHPEVAAALATKRPVVALESTIIAHGMPYPQNVATALQVEAEVRAHGAVPATIAILNGRLKVGLTQAEIEQLGQGGREVVKVSRRDVAFIVAAGADRRHHGGIDHVDRSHGRHPGVCHRRHWRRAPRRAPEL